MVARCLHVGSFASYFLASLGSCNVKMYREPKHSSSYRNFKEVLLVQNHFLAARLIEQHRLSQ